MKIALDPYMLRHVPLTELPAVVAELGYEYIELSPREDFTPFFLHPRANSDRVREFRAALDAAGVQVASHLPLYRWSGPATWRRCGSTWPSTYSAAAGKVGLLSGRRSTAPWSCRILDRWKPWSCRILDRWNRQLTRPGDRSTPARAGAGGPAARR